MNLYIPAIGTKMVLTEPWTFMLFSEDRNNKFIDTLYTSRAFYDVLPKLKLDSDGTPTHRRYSYEAREFCNFTLPTGTQLSVSRVYIRLGQKEFDSITFNASVDVIHPTTKKPTKVKGRFWVKLTDANTIKMDVLP